MIGLEGSGKVLGAKQGKVVFDREDLGFGVEMINWGHFDAAGGGAKGGVLDCLEFFDVAVGNVWEPDGTCIGEE